MGSIRICIHCRAKTPSMGQGCDVSCARKSTLYTVLNGFVNNLTGRQCEVAGDATQEQSTNGMNQTDRIRHHSDVGV